MRKVFLGELFELNYGKSLRKDKRNPGPYPVYGSNGPVDFHNQFLVDRPTIVVGRKGSIGEVHLVTSPCWPIDTTYFVKLQDEYDVDLGWLFRLLQTMRLPELNRSAAIPGLNRDDVYRIEIPLPPLEDQIRIAHLLGKVEGLIAQRKQHLQQLDDLLKSVFLEMFGDPVRNEKGWIERPLNTIFSVKHGFAFKSEFFNDTGNLVLLTPGNFFEDGGYRDRCNKQKFYIGEVPEEYILRKNDLLIAMTEQAPGLLGSPLIVPESRRYLHNQRLGLACAKEPFVVGYLFHLFNQKSVRQMIHTKATGTKVRHTSPTKIESIVIGYPPISLQSQFATIADKNQGIKSRYQKSLFELENLYGALSQKAFKGELDLSHVPLPEHMPDERVSTNLR
jgi:type I restriction enzyme, S subunit